jgi:hypothetical protein
MKAGKIFQIHDFTIAQVFNVLLRYLGYGDIVYIDFVLADHIPQEIERALELA